MTIELERQGPSGPLSGGQGPSGPPSAAQAVAGRRRAWIVGAVVLAALGFLLVQGLGNATLYFRTADEAVAQRASLGSRRFRIEGTVEDGSVRALAGGFGVTFAIVSKGVSVPVVHRGDPPALFKPGIPVVLEGRFVPGDGATPTFESDRVMVKHSATYVAQHPDRVTASTSPGAPGGPPASSPSQP